MIFETYIPKPPLDRFVQCLIFHEAFSPLHRVDRFLPDGNVEIIIDLNDQAQFIYDNDSLKEIQACNRVWASGVRTEPITIPSGKDASMMIVAFKRGMAYPFFPFPMNEIADCVVDADLIWGDDFALLREQISENKRSNRKFEIVEEFLVRAHLSRMILNPCVEYAIETIVATPDAVSMGELTQKIGFSQKHFISMFTKQVGITPKRYLKIMRFQKTIELIENQRVVDWSDIAHGAGFFDQSHFIHDFKTFSGFTPDDYARRKNDLLNYVPVG
ncbi:MAG: helix-turn-helix transcriptional regulator [Acidobacteria bacterium]|nr:helix-turn-helix transcriptional regulator [Acidobacteriota bacterium]MBK8146852.1 helix-turn-helix transcriptional regulator [Acidobacteriota bacterium]MBK8813094.1 helix-turn-helix transcriptional regulator [Acidobacteriota bacterium]